MNCRENRYFFSPPPHPIRRGGVRGENFKVTKHTVLKSIPGMQLSSAIITLQIFRAKPGNPREGGRVERSNEWGGRSREGEARANPGNQLVDNKLILHVCSHTVHQSQCKHSMSAWFYVKRMMLSLPTLFKSTVPSTAYNQQIHVLCCVDNASMQLTKCIDTTYCSAYTSAGLRLSTATTKLANCPVTDAPDDIVVNLSGSFQLDFVLHDAPDGVRRQLSVWAQPATHSW